MKQKNCTGRRKEINMYKNVLAYLLLVVTLLLFSSVNVSAITGSGGGITLTGDIGTIGYYSNTSGNISYGGSGMINGAANGSSPSLDLTIGTLNILDSMTLQLVSPSNNSGVLGPDVNFRYIINSMNAVVNCSIYIDGSPYYTNTFVPNGLNGFDITGLSYAKHYWTVACFDNQTNYINASAILTNIRNYTFDSGSTNLSAVNIENITNLTFVKSGFGRIKYNVQMNLSSSPDILSNVIIGNNSIFVNSTADAIFNRSATLTLYNLDYTSPIILKNGALCSDCSIISYSGGIIIFNVTGFSNYTIAEDGVTLLEIFDDTDNNLTGYINQSVGFYANYSNMSNGDYINGICEISFYISGWTSPVPMQYNSSIDLYFYNRSFLASGPSTFNVSCTNTLGFENISLTDTYMISSLMPSTFADVTPSVINSSRLNLTPGVSLASGAGNTTELNIDGRQITGAWQGYFGNITGTVMLKDVNGNSLYDWNFTNAQGEIYASRSAGIDWINIQCANNTELSTENSYLGLNDNSGDAVNKTFTAGTLFTNFFVGNVQIINSVNCHSTYLFDETGDQSSDFTEVLLHDKNSLIYTALISSEALGFDNSTHDFEMIVGENGLDTSPTPYYFFIELS